MTDKKNLLKKADAAELKASRTRDSERRADLLQIAVCLRWLAQRETIALHLLERLDRKRDKHA